MNENNTAAIIKGGCSAAEFASTIECIKILVNTREGLDRCRLLNAIEYKVIALIEAAMLIGREMIHQ